jgi:precorrin-6A/cobalt-precorrin-6A reductase
MSGCIWLIGGTAESVQLARLLAAANLPLLVSVTTTAARELYASIPDLKIIIGHLKTTAIPDFLLLYEIKIVIDASHPHAVAISQGAIAACQSTHTPYLRYERPVVEHQDSQVIELPSIEHLLVSNYLEGQRVLLTLGYKSLHCFQNYHERATLFARILPYASSVAMAVQAGFTSDRLIAIRPPVSLALEKALWQLWQISVVVTKASGHSGGEEVKRQVAEELGIPLVVISRPQINYPQVTSNLEEVVKFSCPYFVNHR